MADKDSKKVEISCDVLVVGTGAAGMVAATRAHDRGLDVLILERSDKVGGASAASGGMIWIPQNHHMAEVGATDSKEEVMTYLRRLSQGRVPETLMETYVDKTPEMMKYIEENTPLEVLVTKMPDYRQDLAGAKPFGRSLSPQLFDSNLLGEWADKLRPAPLTFLPITIEELFGEWHGMVHPAKMRWDIIFERIEKGMLGCGRALAAGLLMGCLDRKIKIQLEARARKLVREDGKITGLVAEIEGKETVIGANRGVILACGGFEWNQEYIKQFLPGPLTHPVTPPYAEGDGLKMAMDVGADLGNMTEAWGLPALQIPGEEHEGKPLSRISMIERSLPHSIIVNRRGKRFVNEACNYNDLYKSFYTFNPSVYEYENLPAWLIFDNSYREQYGFMTVMPKDPDPEWLDREDSLEALAEKIEVDPKGLAETVERFNKLAGAGVDEDFLRGGNVYDRYFGDPEHEPNPCLGPIGNSPFYALPVYPGACGTKGGPKVNTKGQVINAYGEAIPGLYAAGNVMAVVSGPGYGGNGGTLGPAMTWGYICAENV